MFEKWLNKSIVEALNNTKEINFIYGNNTSINRNNNFI